MRRFGAPPVKGRVYLDRPGVYSVILRGGEALLAEQNGDLLLPGGGIEKGESVLQALHREVWEETGWAVAPVRRLGVYARYCWLAEEAYWSRKVAHIYLCRPVRRISAPKEPDHSPVWMDGATALHLLDADGERVFMARALGVPEALVPLRGA